MDTIDKLENTIHMLGMAGKKLRRERDDALKETDRIRQELKNFRQINDELRLTVENLKKNSRSLDELEAGKKEIISRVQTVLNRLEHFSLIDKFTNDQD